MGEQLRPNGQAIEADGPKTCCQIWLSTGQMAEELRPTGRTLDALFGLVPVRPNGREVDAEWPSN